MASNDAQPIVSVVIPTYNRPELLKGAIRSVLSQTFQDFEIIVVDDGLQKRADIAVKSFNDERIVYIQHEENKGCSASKNTGIRSARGKYVAILDDDDEFLPEKLALQVRALERASSNVGFSFTGSIEVFDDREQVFHVPEGEGDYHELALRNFSTLIDSSMMYRREVFDTAGYLDETYPTHTGAEFVIRVTGTFLGVGIDTPLVKRIMQGDHEHMGTNIHKRIQGRLMLLRQYADEFERYPAFKAKHIERLAKFYREVSDWQNARICFWRAFLIQPRLIRFLYTASMFLNGLPYRVFQRLKS